ncbi:hypothetical protein SynBIOSU31_03102 [Synechococcus sp. BIOS-U3-1]|nr:hypothetical protein SynBIOSU31_00633 [Synechococcus sp. BIOS-U3-1]QNI59949.1 hypothetical protein SynBIOSU31_03102 [Synechococcus sp. BIOS-U3-1]
MRSRQQLLVAKKQCAYKIESFHELSMLSVCMLWSNDRI